MEALLKLSTILGLSLTSGVNLYATVAVVGLVTKYNVVTGLPVEFNAFNNDAIIVVAVILYICEFLADKLPGFDTLWDVVHTLIRPIGGAFLAVVALGETDQTVEIITALMGASVAFGSHSVKMGTRMLVNTSPEPFSNSAVSVTEDVAVVGFTYLVLAHPYIALAVSVLVIILLFMYGPLMFRTVILYFKAVFAKIASLVQINKYAERIIFLPDAMENLLDNTLGDDTKFDFCLPAYSRKVPGIKRNKKGFLALTSQGRLFFIYKKALSKPLMKEFLLSDMKKVKLNRKFLFDVLYLRVHKNNLQFIFLKKSPIDELTENIEKRIPSLA